MRAGLYTFFKRNNFHIAYLGTLLVLFFYIVVSVYQGSATVAQIVGSLGGSMITGFAFSSSINVLFILGVAPDDAWGDMKEFRFYIGAGASIAAGSTFLDLLTRFGLR